MKAFRQFGIVILLLVSYLTPAMACMVSDDVPMSAVERTCCQAMQNRCEQMEMPASHGCCQKATHSTLDKALITKARNYQPVLTVTVWLTADEQLQPSIFAAERNNRADDSPPQFPPGSNSILRI